jgi:hypothetical protein
VSAQSIKELATSFENLDVVVNEYGPHSAGADALQYSKFKAPDHFQDMSPDQL